MEAVAIHALIVAEVMFPDNVFKWWKEDLCWKLGYTDEEEPVKGEEQQSKIRCAFHEGGGHQYQELLRSSQMKTSSKRKSWVYGDFGESSFLLGVEGSEADQVKGSFWAEESEADCRGCCTKLEAKN